MPRPPQHLVVGARRELLRSSRSRTQQARKGCAAYEPADAPTAEAAELRGVRGGPWVRGPADGQIPRQTADGRPADRQAGRSAVGRSAGAAGRQGKRSVVPVWTCGRADRTLRCRRPAPVDVPCARRAPGPDRLAVRRCVSDYRTPDTGLTERLPLDPGSLPAQAARGWPLSPSRQGSPVPHAPGSNPRRSVCAASQSSQRQRTPVRLA